MDGKTARSLASAGPRLIPVATVLGVKIGYAGVVVGVARGYQVSQP